MHQSIRYVRFEHESPTGLKHVDLTVDQYGVLKNLYASIREQVAAFGDAVSQDATLYSVELSAYTTASLLRLGDKSFIDIRKKAAPQNQNAQQTQQQQQPTGSTRGSGISIRSSEWETLISNLQPLYAAIQAGDLNYQLQVSIVLICVSVILTICMNS